MLPEIVTVAGKDYRLARWPRRIMARFIDVAIAIVVCIAVGVAGGDDWLTLAIPLTLAYLVLGSALLGGQSLGKRVLGIKVIDAKHGRPCGVMQDIVRQRYLLYYNPLFLALSAFDTAQGYHDQPELYVVRTSEVTASDRAARQEVAKEKPAKLDLAAMRASLQKPRDENHG